MPPKKYWRNYEILVSIAAALERHMRCPKMLLDDIEIATRPPLLINPKEKLLDAIANLLPRHPKERIALTARSGQIPIRIFVTSSDDTCDPFELHTYLSGLWPTLREVAQFYKMFRIYLRGRQQQLEKAGDTQTKVVDEQNDEGCAQFGKEGRALCAKLGEQVYARCRGRLNHEIKRRWRDFQSCLSFLKTKAVDMDAEQRSIVLRTADDLNRYLSAISDGELIQDSTGRVLGVYALLSKVYFMKEEKEFKRLVLPLLDEYRDNSGFDLYFYLLKVGSINASVLSACTSTKSSSLRNLFELDFTITLSPPTYQTPTTLPSTSDDWKAFLDQYAKHEDLQFVDLEKIIRLLLDVYPPASQTPAPVRYHSELELFTYLYDHGIAQQMAILRDGEAEELYIATSHRPCSACIYYFLVVRQNDRKYGLPPLDTRYDYNGSVFPCQIPRGSLERERDVTYLFVGEFSSRIGCCFRDYGIAVSQ